MNKFTTGLLLSFFTLTGVTAIAQLPTTTTEAAGYDPVKLAKIQELLDPLYESGRIPNYVVALAKGGRIFYSAMRGDTEIGSGNPVTLDTVYALASMTKPLTTTVAFQLMQEGKLAFEDGINQFYPDFEDLLVAPGGSFEADFQELEREITILDLITHTSGFTYGESVIGKGDVAKQYDDLGVFTGEGSLRTADENAEILAEVPLIAQPGTAFNYSIGLDLLGGILEQIEGKRLGQIFKERLFNPLGMQNSGFRRPEKAGSYAVLYGIPKVGQSPLGQVSGSDIIWKINKADGLRNPYPAMDAGGGGMYGSADDYLRYLTMLTTQGAFAGQQILDPASVKQHFTDLVPGIAFRPARNFGEGAALVAFGGGFGIRLEAVDSEDVDYYFWGGANNTGFWIDRQDGSVGVFLTQHFPSRYNMTGQLEELVDAARL